MVHSFRPDKPRHGELTTCNVMWATTMYEDESSMIYAYWHDVISFDQIGPRNSKGSFTVGYYTHKSMQLNIQLNISFRMPDRALTLASLQILTPKHRESYLVAYEWQWTSLADNGRWFFIHWFLGQLVKPVVHLIQLKNHHGRSFSFIKNKFWKKRI